jgi:2-polyprenyl-3-methyl-5-hydroxy-6-metoxy-1,4-benzoquinol methylase
MSNITLHATRCAICGTEDNASELYPASFDIGHFNPAIFSARRLPDRIHYRMVKCSSCGLVRSDPIADAATLGELYRKSTFDYGSQVNSLRITYGRYLDRLVEFGACKGALLEIGCGNGFFLEVARERGYADVRGVEPGSSVVKQAVPGIRERIVCEMMRPGLFAQGTFDVVCLFQVFDHVSDPAALLNECTRILKSGGHILILNHNIESFSARLLGERSPIIDIEHTFLYSPATISKLAENAGLVTQHTGSVFNLYPLQYIFRLVPFPASLKRMIHWVLNRTGLGKIPLYAPLGNLILIAQKP